MKNNWIMPIEEQSTILHMLDHRDSITLALDILRGGKCFVIAYPAIRAKIEDMYWKTVSIRHLIERDRNTDKDGAIWANVSDAIIQFYEEEIGALS